MPKKPKNSLPVIEVPEEGEFIGPDDFPEENIPPELMMMIAEKAGDFLGEQMRLEAQAQKARRAASRPATRRKKLKKMLDSWQENHAFSVGEFVEWKPNMRNRPRPYAKEPAIVIELLDKPLYDQMEDSTSQLFFEPLNIVIGIMSEDSEEDGGETFTLVYVDRRRLKPVS